MRAARSEQRIKHTRGHGVGVGVGVGGGYYRRDAVVRRFHVV